MGLLYLQNSPAQGLIPEEDRAVMHILATLEPYTQANGGKLKVEHVSFVKGRGNVIITYPGTSESGEVISFVGSHLGKVLSLNCRNHHQPLDICRCGTCQ